MVATNTGDRPGIIVLAALNTHYLDTAAVELNLVNPNDAFVPTGARQIGLTFGIRLGGGEARTKAIEVSRALLRLSGRELHANTAGIATVEIQQSDGAVAYANFRISYDDLYTVLSAHATRCEMATTPPTLENGCASISEMHDENDRLANEIEADDPPRR